MKNTMMMLNLVTTRQFICNTISLMSHKQWLTHQIHCFLHYTATSQSPCYSQCNNTPHRVTGTPCPRPAPRLVSPPLAAMVWLDSMLVRLVHEAEDFVVHVILTGTGGNLLDMTSQKMKWQAHSMWWEASHIAVHTVQWPLLMLTSSERHTAIHQHINRQRKQKSIKA